MRHIFAFLAVLTLSACVAPQPSPTVYMTSQDVQQLSDARLCDFQTNYEFEKKLDIEMARRGLECDAASLECRSRGLRPQTYEYQICRNDIQGKLMAEEQNNRYEAMIYQQNKKMEQMQKEKEDQAIWDEKARIDQQRRIIENRNERYRGRIY